MIFLRLAWRNLFRNKRRTILASLAIGLGLSAVIFTDALMGGITNNFISTATGSWMGEGQVHSVGFRNTQEIENIIKNREKAEKILHNDPHIKSSAPRVISTGMITSPTEVQSVLLAAVDPQQERTVSRIANAVKEGEFLSSAEGREILIGVKLATVLEVEIGDKVVLTAAQAFNGELAQEMFRIKGIFDMGSRDMNGSFALIPLKTAQKMLNLKDGIHEIAFQFKDIKQSTDTTLPLWKELKATGNEPLNWGELMTELSTMLEMTDFALGLSSLILFIIVSAGIVNTLFMSLYERMFEFGVLKAIGTRPFQLGKLIVLEAASLGAISSLFGMLIAAGILLLTSYTGIDYRGTEFVSVAITDLLYPVVQIHQFIIYPLGMIFFIMVVGIYPAWYAARITPATAMRKKL
ncbi:ABC transporter permease [bacterium]|nr:ABC transporter permease [bacterium]